jgi:hypothetical protein
MSVADDHRRVLADALALADREIGELRGRLAEAQERADAETTAAAEARGQAAEAQRALADVTGSMSWRITAPLRAGIARARGQRSR